ncbi:hypothetical protein FJTKL_15206 [Diaporthe vaccinii]|uniref:Uncharacterized protein n=1 Tax=Diaporthe vaccinii TaxID=105482 RepID=A0ABR4E5R1_9PEZI
MAAEIIATFIHVSIITDSAIHLKVPICYLRRHLINDLGQILEPLISTPARADVVVDHTIEDNSGANVDSDQTGNPDSDLQVIRHPVANVQAAIIGSLLGNGQQLVHLALAHAGAVCGKLGQALIRGVPGLVDDVDVKVRLLVVEESLAEGPKLRRSELVHGEGSLVNEG